MSTRNRPLAFSVITVCMAMVAALALPTAALVTSIATSAPADAAVITRTASQLRIDVSPTMKSSAPDWPDKVGVPLDKSKTAHFKWIIQQDNSGDPAQPSGPLASNDGTITCGAAPTYSSASCILTSPSAPFQYSGNGVAPDPKSPDLHVPVTGQNLTGTITSVTSPTRVTITRTGSATLHVVGTYLFSILRSDPCHPVTPITPQGDPNFPQGCNWPSIHAQQHPPIVTQGDETDWSSTQSLSGLMQVDSKLNGGENGCSAGTRVVLNINNGGGGEDGCHKSLPDGKYFVSVTANGYEIGGTSFTIPMQADNAHGTAVGTVHVGLNPAPMPLATIKLLVFDDMAPTGGWWEQTTEAGMSGFTGFITDFTGNPVTQDYYGNPICTTYTTDAAGNVLLKPDGTPVQILKLGGRCESQPAVLGMLHSPLAAHSAGPITVDLVNGATTQFIPQPGVNEQGTFNVQIGADLVTVTHVDPNNRNVWTLDPATVNQGIKAGTNVPDPSNQPVSDGVITIPNIVPGRYGANVVPPDKAWIQTSTLEGGHDFDVWAMGNDNGLDNEMVVAGEPVPFVQFGFARATMVTTNPALGTLCNFSQSPPAHPQPARADGGNPCPRPSGAAPIPDEVVPVGTDLTNPANWLAKGDPMIPVSEGFDPNNLGNQNTPTAGAYETAGCQIEPVSAADGAVPTGDIRAQFTLVTKPCGGHNITPRIYPGVGGQSPTPDGALQADSWEYPWYNTAVYGNLKAAPTGEIKGTIAGEEPYVPGVGGFNGSAGANGQAGEQIANIKIPDAWVALADLNNGDLTSIVAPAKNDGTIDITGVPDGTYNLAWWDWNQDYAFDQYQVIVQNGQVVDLGMLALSDWFTTISGHVFVDKNGNGKQDPGEAGVPDFLMQLLNRTNNAWEGGQNVATTIDSGYYSFQEAYPLGNDMILQFYNPRYKTTGVTCQSDNDPQQHTTLTGAVDLTTLNIIGLNGTCDIGVQPYNTDPTQNDNGGIVATAMYHSFRTELAQEQAFTSGFDTGQPGVRFSLWQPRPIPATATPAQVAANTGGKYLTCTKENVAAHNISAHDLGCGVWNYDGTSTHPDSYRLDGGLVRDPVPFDQTNTSQLDVYYSEHWGRGGNAASQAQGNPGCVPRGADGQVLDWHTQAAVLPGGDCVEAALQGTSFAFGTDGNPIDPKLFKNNIPSSSPLSLDPGLNTGPFTNSPDPYPGVNAYCKTAPDTKAQCGPHGVQTVDGNYAMTPPNPGDYIVEATVPNDMFGKPLYRWANEANNNTYDSPGWVPPGAATGTLSWSKLSAQQSDVSTVAKSDGYSLTPSTGSASLSAKCVGSSLMIDNTDPGRTNPLTGSTTNPDGTPVFTPNPAYVLAYQHGGKGAPPFEGQLRQKCDDKLIHVQNGQSYAPNFQMFTDVPLATKFSGYATDDISVSTNRLSTGLGEVQPIPNLPIGIYDWTGRQVQQVNTDYNGQWEVMLPSTNTFLGSTVAGPAATVYRFVGNDPGQPAHPNLNWNPTYVTIAAQFQAWPDVYTPSDVAPTRAVVAFEGNGSQLTAAAICAPQASQPQLYTVSHPFFKPAIGGTGGRTDTYKLTIQGVGFGTSKPAAGGVTLRKPGSTTIDPSGVVLSVPNADITSWSDTQIVITLATGTASATTLVALAGVNPGPYELQVTNSAGLTTTNGLTFHVLGSTYNPTLYEVGRFRTGITSQIDNLANAGNNKILDNGSINQALVDAGTPIAALKDSTTGGFNPANQNFAPANTTGDPNVINTASVSDAGGAASSAFPGDGTVKGALQRALEAAYHHWNVKKATNNENLIVVYPNFQNLGNGTYGGAPFDPLTAYYENIIIHSPVMLQGTGPGGLYRDSVGNTVAVAGTTIDGRFFNGNTTAPATTADTAPNSEPWAADWQQLFGLADNTDGLVASQPFWNSETEDQGEVVDVLGNGTGGANNGPWYTTDANGYRPSLDGFQITGGDQKDFPGNIGEVAGGNNGQPPDETFSIAQQGGGVYLNGYAQHFQISNNLFQYNSGTYGGAIRSGTPQNAGDGFDIAHNDDLHVHHNRIIANGGTNLAGAIGLFRGTDGYRINDNLICGNLSAEYGGGVSVFGYSPHGTIDHNKLMLNQSVDEGGAIMIAGEPPVDPNTFTPNPNLLSMGAGTTTIDSNYIGDNLAQDDGGGVRFLEAGVEPMLVTNNMITDNVSAHEGGAVAIDNAPDVRLVNDTIANNITTATATTSTGDPAPAGISTAGINVQLHDFLTHTGLNATIPVDQPDGTTKPETCAQLAASPTECGDAANQPFSNPLVMDDVVWGNLAGTWDAMHTTVTGIGLPQNLQYSGPAGACPAGGAAAPCIAPLWDPGPNNWDIGVADGSNVGKDINPVKSLIESNYGWSGGTGNRVGGPDPQFVQSYLPAVQVDPYRLQPRFRPSQLVTVNFPANVLGDYSIPGASGAVGIDTTGSTTLFETINVASPHVDIALNPRPSGVPATWDAGAFQPAGVVVPPAVTPVGGGGGAGIPGPGAPGGTGGAGGTNGSGGGTSGSSGGTNGSGVKGGKGAGGKGSGTPAILDAASTHTTVPRGSTTHGPTRPTGAGSSSGSSSLGFGTSSAGGPQVSTAQPPAGSSIGVDTVGGADSAGNTPVIQVPGSTQGGATGAAGMPGGVAGGGHFQYPNHIHHKTTHKSAFALDNPLLWIPAAIVAALAALLYRRRRRPSHRRRRGGPSGQTPPSSPPPDDDPASGRQLELVGKGELS
jgi:hypothetical protein